MPAEIINDAGNTDLGMGKDSIRGLAFDLEDVLPMGLRIFAYCERSFVEYGEK